MSSERAEQPAQGAGPHDKHGFPGRILAEQREQMGWTVEQVADQLKMAVRQVTALEAGDYASLPGPAVVRGFVRAYAKVVKLDAAPLVAMIALDTDSAGDTTPRNVRRDKPASFSEVRFPTNGKRGSGLPLGLIGGVILIVAAAAGAWQFGLIPRSLLGAAAPGAVAPAAAGAAGQASVTVLPPPVVGVHGNAQIETTLVKPGEENKPLQSPSVPLISVPPAPGASAPAGAATPPAAPAVAGVAPAAGTVAPAAAPVGVSTPAPSGALVLNVRQDAWIDVRTSGGKKVFSGLVKGGTVKAFDVSGPLTLKVGNAAGVDATLRGTAVPLPPMAGTTVAKVNLQ